MNPLTMPIARLRAAGCKVSTVIGHDPAIGDFVYSIRVPDSFGDLREGTTLEVAFGVASARVLSYSDGRRLTVRAHAYRRGLVTPADVVEHYRRDTATLLSKLADTIEEMTQ